MRKNLGLVFKVSGSVLISSAVLMGCGKHAATSSADSTGRHSNKNGSQMTTCNPTPGKVPHKTRAGMIEEFDSVVSFDQTMTAQQREALYVDRDIKGNEIHYRRTPPPSAPTTVNADAPKIAPWSQKDQQKDAIPGTSTERAYAELNLKTQGDPVVVAVIDSAIDIDHEDLQDRIWTNPAIDADHPGSVHGWNFLGGKNGDVYHTTLELTREVKRMRALKAQGALSATDQAYLEQLETAFTQGKAQAAATLKLRTQSRDTLSNAIDALKAACSIKDGTFAEISKIQSSDPAVLKARDAALASLKQDRDLAWYKASIDHWTKTVKLNDKYYYNLDFDSSTIVGDDPTKMDDVYGDANVKPEDAEEIHATHVSGIIGADRGKHTGLNGQADNVRIMSLRAVPDGDERDKDIGNAIRFAVDHGARVINMSFGKDYSPNRDYVWQQLKYAAAHEVLIVHAAGNDSLNNDVTTHFPEREVTDATGAITEVIPNVIEVGASSRSKDQTLPASFTDYGTRSVDLFAPGVQIYSTLPGNHYGELDGTSMATPEVAGIAALVLSQYPQLTVAQLKQVLLGTTTSYKGLMVIQPNPDAAADDKLVDFGTMSITGGVVNAYAALKAAAAL